MVAGPARADASLLASLVARERAWALFTLAGITALAWSYLVVMVQDMGHGSNPTEGPFVVQIGATLTGGRASPWTATEFGLMFLMWLIMMVGMMLPSATPMILLVATISRRKRHRGRAAAPPGIFATGYVAAWTAFSLAATLLQGGLHRAGQLSSMMMTTSTIVGGLVLVAAGIYQWTPLKTRCLRECQSPLRFLSTHWEDGIGGAFRMGWHHGLFCLGCCGFLMGLLFVGGVMNLVWIAGLAAFVLVEKVWPAPWIPAASGAVLVVWGTVVLTSPL